MALVAVAPTAFAPPPPRAELTWLGPGEIEVAAQGSFASELRIEREDITSSWVTVEQSDPFRLRARCEEPEPAKCTELRMDAPLRPAPWAGLGINAQCGLGARGLGGDAGGKVRFVMTSCDGKSAVRGPELFSSTDPNLAARGWAALDITAVRAVRLDGPIANWQPSMSRAMGKLLGLPIRVGSERTLDTGQRERLATLLSHPTGYNDRIVKRCRMEHMLGFVITHTLPSTAAAPRSQEVEVALDSSCHKIFIGRGELAPRALHSSHFDALRGEYLALVKSVFVGDAEIAALR